MKDYNNYKYWVSAFETMRPGYKVTVVLDDDDSFILCLYSEEALKNNSGVYIAPYYQVNKMTGAINEFSPVRDPKHFKYLLDNRVVYEYSE